MVLLVPLFTGCAGSARYLRRERDGGEIALSGAYVDAVGQARVLMTRHCDGRFVVLGRNLGGRRNRLVSPAPTQQHFDFVCERTTQPTLASR
jgi:hypothetical protein